LLNAALARTGRKGPVLTADNWREEVRGRVPALDWRRARADVKPFLEREPGMDLVTRETLDSRLASGA